MSGKPDSRRSRRLRARAPIKLGLDNRLLYLGDRAAVVRLVCRVCEHPLVDFSRSMVVEDGAVYDGASIPRGVTTYFAGPADDPEQRYAFDGKCGRVDIILTRAKIERATAELLRLCQEDDTPRTVRLPL